MAAIIYLTDLKMNQNQIINASIENITEDDVIDPQIGQLIFDTNDGLLKFYTGTYWEISNARLPYRLIYRGSVPYNFNPTNYETGDLYIFNSGGTAINFNNLVVQAGDFVFYNGDINAWVSVQGNVTSATTSNPGIVEIATNEEVLAGIDAERVVVSKYLSNWENQTDKALRRKRVFENQTINSEGLVLYHHIGKNNVAVDVYDSTGQKVYLDIEKDINMITLKSNIEITGIKIVISA
jgi:hypothetical protein